MNGQDLRRQVTRTVRYYPVGGALRINITGDSNTLYYILKDYLGSASVVTDSTGTDVGEQRYYPYGETRFTSGNIFTDKLFTGQRDIVDPLKHERPAEGSRPFCVMGSDLIS